MSTLTHEHAVGRSQPSGQVGWVVEHLIGDVIRNEPSASLPGFELGEREPSDVDAGAYLMELTGTKGRTYTLLYYLITNLPS